MIKVILFIWRIYITPISLTYHLYCGLVDRYTSSLSFVGESHFCVCCSLFLCFILFHFNYYYHHVTSVTTHCYNWHHCSLPLPITNVLTTVKVIVLYNIWTLCLRMVFIIIFIMYYVTIIILSASQYSLFKIKII